MFHHDPASDDEALSTTPQETRRYEAIVREGSPLKISSAYGGLVIGI